MPTAVVAAIILLSGCQSFSKKPYAESGPPSPLRQVGYEEPENAAPDGSSPSEEPSVSDLLSDVVKKATGKEVSPEKARKIYAEAEAEYRIAVAQRGRVSVDQSRAAFRAAAATFQRAAKLWPDSAIEEDALFRAGESYFFADAYPDANEAFELLVEEYPSTRYQDHVQARRFAIARYWLQFQNADPQSWYTVNFWDTTRPTMDLGGNAMRLFKKIPLDDPTGKLADDAILAQANAKFVKGRYDEADQLYSDLRTMYPTSEHQFTAHLMGVKTKLLRYQGAAYDGDVLDETEKLIRQLRTQFPQESAANSELLDRAEREVRYRKAEREWFMAEFYDRIKAYQAARFYYQIVQKDYGDTPFAAKSQARMAEIAGRPPVPEQKLQWLTRFFPSSKPDSPLLNSNHSVHR